MNNWMLYSIFFFAIGVTAQSKTTYTYAIKGVDTLKLDVYSPKELLTTDNLSALLWMHGGGFSGGTRDNKAEQELCEYVANKGYIGISISYRLLRKGTKTGFGCDCPKEAKLETFKQAVIDYLDAAKYIVKHADNLNIDTDKIIAGGSSAGAEGILNAVYMKEYFIDNLMAYEGIKFAGVFALAGATVNVNYMTKKNALPTVLFHGTKDNLVPFGSAPHHYCDLSKDGYIMLDGSETIVKKLDDFEKPYYFNKVVGGGHELASIPFEDLDRIFDFFNRTVVSNEVIQTTIIKKKE